MTESTGGTSPPRRRRDDDLTLNEWRLLELELQRDKLWTEAAAIRTMIDTRELAIRGEITHSDEETRKSMVDLRKELCDDIASIRNHQMAGSTASIAAALAAIGTLVSILFSKVLH